MEMECEAEVVSLHQFFQDWYNGVLEDNDENFDRLSKVIASDFVQIRPDALVRSRDQLLPQVRSAHGGQRELNLRMWIEAFQPRVEADKLILVMYHEWQEREGKAQGRICTAVFRPEPTAPNGVVWVHLQEQWLPESAELRQRPV